MARDTLTICVAHPNPKARCETFIRAHIERLPGRVHALYGGHMPLFEEGRGPLFEGANGPPGAYFSPSGRPETALHAQAVEGVKRFLQTRGVDVVLAEYGPTGVAMFQACRDAGVPLVVHFHGYDASIASTLEKYRQGYLRMFEYASAIIAVSGKMERDLAALGAPGERLVQNVYGVDPDLFSGASPDAARPVFAAVGRFVDKKAPHLTILAFQKALEFAPDARLVMIGHGPLWESCSRMVQELGLLDRVELAGAKPHEEIMRAMRLARAFVQHSVMALSGDCEGTPVSVLEAMAAGLPVIGTRHGGISDVVLDGGTGLLCDEGDVEAMARFMVRLASEPETAAAMGQKGRERVLENYAMKERMAALADILYKAAREAGGK